MSERDPTSGGASAARVAALCRDLAAAGIRVWIDGGWGVDALLGAETRPHRDLDIVVEDRDLARLRALLAAHGFADSPRPDARPWNFVLADTTGFAVDVHAIVFDQNGDGIYGPPANDQRYPASAFGWRGVIGGLAVDCLSPQFQMANHAGYQLGESDRHDMRRLAERFGLKFPPR
jgi:lincosamide nucleotidyltransferase A/C/D/E